ncbi:cytochrome c biogenesis protein ResB [Nocardia cyriacigeorgica]|jgi:cytochrome c biogenesis protein|uniref:cytochrome c biogenesis protein ResB n=1 Tax=Nocardia cyriacigeorgica TaxID=135487 RepID=UPI000CE9FFF7|nr:cytochrome c biogenesis protein ResB [Nocardia cyriacigeorgica]AVH21984.1 cytochrome C biogenesis protein ResB [Nocardia cyriacigeorgica]MBF6085511.1 cytochrome c biogenesis protein ResB [Nocardia cyriacigeorgica]PPJ11532.1 cytochrome C biogenesis protein ResB [Nocardia cyriacigeorgica]
MTVIDRPDAPARPPRQSLPGRVLAFVRNTWRGLTSMRTALVLLFLLALAAIPGALLPQRELNEQKVAQYIADRPTLGPWMDRFQLFDVFSSSWFTAIYVLLFISLVGCILPRAVDHYRALRTPPVRVPRNLARLPHHYSATVDGTPDEVIAGASGQLRRWRTAMRPGDRDGEVTLSAEKGYAREFGNLVFHLALVGLLVSIAVGKLFGYEGSVIVIANNGPGFCSTSPAAFDSFRTGSANDGTGMTPICVRVKDFHADYLDNGQAEMFRSNIAYQAGEDFATDTWRETEIRVNHPLRVAGDRIYLQGHGYAPTFTVKFPNGETRTETVQWRPDDATTFLSSGVLRIDPPGGLYPTEEERRNNQIAIEGLFAPTANLHGTLLTSSYPEMTDPAVAVDIYRGDTGLDTGRPQSLFALDQELIRQERLTKETRVNLRPGESATLSNGTVVTFDGAEEFVNLQVSHDPAQQWVLVSAVTMMAGLLVSLLVSRRRIWLRVYPADAEAGTVDQRRVVVEMGGLARSDQAGWGGEFDRLRARLLGDGAPDDAPTATGKTTGDR